MNFTYFLLALQPIIFLLLLLCFAWLWRLERKLKSFSGRFNTVMAEAERQNEREAQWNEGLNNILNYSFNDAFKTGGDKQ